MRQRVRAAVKAGFAFLANDLVTALLRLSEVAHRSCNGDLEEAYIILMVAIRTFQHPDFQKIDLDKLEPSGPELPSLGTNARSIAASSGIPVETVRRKVSALRHRGFIARLDHDLALTVNGLCALEPVKEVLIDLAVDNYFTVSKVWRGDAGPKLGQVVLDYETKAF